MFEFDGSASYQFKRQTRCLTALEGDTDHNRFVLASLELREPNELHVLDFNEDTNEVGCLRAYTHPHETWHISSCPAPEHVELVMTTHSTGTEQRTALWRMAGLEEDVASAPEDGTGAPPAAPAATPLTELLPLGGAMRLGECRALLWNAVLPEQVCVLREGALDAYQLSHGGAASSATPLASLTLSEQDWGAEAFCCGRWDSHHAHSLALGADKSLLTIDMRSMKKAHTVADAHQQNLRSIDYNPNKPHVLLTCGDDYAIRWWDLRKPQAPLLAQKAHSHWVTSALYNRFHDQLVLSAGTDSAVKLWRVASASSAPSSLEPDEDGAEAEADGLVKSFEEHESSVFGLAWSAADAWVFASLSLDGRAILNHVPPAEKYKILL